MGQAVRVASPWPAVLAACVLLAACATPRGAHHQYAQSLDSGSAGCRQNPALCRAAAGERAPAIPPARTPAASSRPSPAPPALSGPQAAALTIAAVGRVVQVVIDASLEARIREALAECADKARADVMYKHFQRSPTRAECNKVVAHDEQGQPITRAMLLGREQHQAALDCAEQRLRELKPGGFTPSPRYRYDSSTGKTQFIPREQVEALLNQGRSAELRGTLEPDLVIHLPGQPLHVQLVFDFKFQCAHDRKPAWRKYPEGHPYAGFEQKDVYMKFLTHKVFRVLPHWGVLP